MLKRKRRLNKAHLIDSSLAYGVPLPLAYAELVRCGVPPSRARAMVWEAAALPTDAVGPDTSSLIQVVIWHATSYKEDWENAHFGWPYGGAQ